MIKYNLSYTHKHQSLWSRCRDGLVYLPGALVMLYGFWLSLIA